MNKWVFKENSLDLIRLIAASQVMVLHSFEFTMSEVTGNLFFEILRLFPGVPIFFFISGYLISKSFERAPNLSTYWINRGLRIFPALIVCVFINILMVWSTGYFNETNPSVLDVFLLFLGKATVLQFYNPDFMRGFGDGVLNGSLWTIFVELQFYFIVPIFYNFFKLKNKYSTYTLIALIIIFIFANSLLPTLASDYSNEIWWKLFRVSFAPWVYMFLFGVLVQRNFIFFARWLSQISIIPTLIIYITIMLYISKNGLEFGNYIPPYVFFPLALLIFRTAYSMVSITKKLLRGNDISYGIYIWHIPLINQLIYLTKSNETLIQVGLAILSTILIALISWFYLEKTALKMKSFSLLRTKR